MAEDEYGIQDVKREVQAMKERYLPFAIHWYTCVECNDTYVCEHGLKMLNMLENGG